MQSQSTKVDGLYVEAQGSDLNSFHVSALPVTDRGVHWHMCMYVYRHIFERTMPCSAETRGRRIPHKFKRAMAPFAMLHRPWYTSPSGVVVAKTTQGKLSKNEIGYSTSPTSKIQMIQMEAFDYLICLSAQ